MPIHNHNKLSLSIAHFKPSIILGLIELIKTFLNQSPDEPKPSNDGILPFLIFCLILWTIIAFMESFNSVF